MQNEHDLRELTRTIREGGLIPERSGEYWSKDEREEMVRSFRSGVGISEIALQLQRSEIAVVQQLVVMKLLISPRAGHPRRTKQARCLCEKCQFGPNKCKKADRCVREETYA